MPNASRKALFSLIEKTNNGHEVIEIASPKGNAVLMSADEHTAWQENEYLFRSPVNARRLLDSYERVTQGNFSERRL